MGFISNITDRRVKSAESLIRRVSSGGASGKPSKTNYEGYTSLAGTPLAIERLIRAQRSRAPYGWKDDRWEMSRHFTGINYVAIHRTGKQLSMAEFQVFRKDKDHPDGKRPVTQDDPPEGGRLCRPWDLVELLEKPNWRDSWGQLMYRWNLQKCLFGEALTWMLPNKLGTPMELYVMPTPLMSPGAQSNPEFPEGYYRMQAFYPYGPFSQYPTPQASAGAQIDARWVLQFMEPDPLIFGLGYSPLTAMKLEMDEFDSIGVSRFYKMKGSVNPAAVLDFTNVDGMEPLPQREIERIHAEFENSFQGPQNAGKLIVGTPGGELKEFGSKPFEMDYPQSWDQLMSFILGGGFGITKPAAGMIEDSSYSTLFATLKQLHMVTLEPDCSLYAAMLTRRLAPFFGDDLIVEIRCKRIDDHEMMKGQLDTAISAKAITKNEVRKRLPLLDLDPTTEDWGEEIAGTDSMEEQQQMGMGGQPGPAPPPPPLAGKDETAEKLDAEPVDPLEKERDRPGGIGEGSLGPRKALIQRLLKNHNGRVKATNGNGRHA